MNDIEELVFGVNQGATEFRSNELSLHVTLSFPVNSIKPFLLLFIISLSRFKSQVMIEELFKNENKSI